MARIVPLLVKVSLLLRTITCPVIPIISPPALLVIIEPTDLSKSITIGVVGTSILVAIILPELMMVLFAQLVTHLIVDLPALNTPPALLIKTAPVVPCRVSARPSSEKTVPELINVVLVALINVTVPSLAPVMPIVAPALLIMVIPVWVAFERIVPPDTSPKIMSP